MGNIERTIIDRRQPDPKVVPLVERRKPEPVWVRRMREQGLPVKDFTGRAA
jgi:hypothetical protein